jgi:hypothetical protein
MEERKYPHIKTIVVMLSRVILLMAIAPVFLLEGYSAIVQKEGAAPLPPLFGNFPANRAILEKQAEKDEFAFAVIGDTKSHGTFERIVEELHGVPLDFAVLLGDCSYDGTPEEHRYFRAEWANEYAMAFPVFYVVGNHDVSCDAFPISRFEHDYGPSIFSFEYQGCLFIVLRILNKPFSNAESIAFLERLKGTSLEKYRHIFVFMHIPPPISTSFQARSFPEFETLVRLFDELGVDYVFAGDFHGYARVRLRNTNYIVTGGGGAHLSKKKGKQFHHALVMKVGKNSVTEIIVPVPRHLDVEDGLENYAIARVWPWMTRNAIIVYIINAVCLILVLMLIKPFVSHPRKERQAKAFA